MTIELPNTAVFERRKSYVRSHCLSIGPYIASDSDIARGSTTPDVDGGEYISLPSPADSLDNGKNDPNLRSTLTEYRMRAGNKIAAPVRNSSGPPCDRDGGRGENRRLDRPSDCCWQVPQDSCWPRCAWNRLRRCSPKEKNTHRVSDTSRRHSPLRQCGTAADRAAVETETKVTIISTPQGFNEDELYVDLEPLFGRSLFLKCEGFNFAGSIKLKAATEMVEAAERDGALTPGSVLVESSSGNLGVALSMIAASKGYGFLCVTDSRCNLSTRHMMQAFGSQVHVITEADLVGGFLGARINYVQALCASDDRYVWLNQYRNPQNWKAHFRKTAPAIARQFPQLDVLFVGAGTCGTLMGCARYFQEWHRPVRVVAVDSVGSVTFGGPAGRRMIPGLGTSVPPPMLDVSDVDDVVRVEEADTIRACHRLAGKGFLFGGSTGTVISGALSWLSLHGSGELTAVAIAPDLGERYLDTVYHTNWVLDLYGEDVLSSAELTSASRSA